MSSELEVDGYDLVKLDLSKRDGGAACYIKSPITYSYETGFAATSNVFLLTFICLHLCQSYWVSYADKSDFVKHIINVFTETRVLGKQECYLLGVLNLNLLLNEKEIFTSKCYRTNGKNLPPQTKIYLDFCVSFSLEQLIAKHIRVDKTASLIDHVLNNSSQKVSQYCVIVLCILDHNLVYCTRKTPSLKLSKHNDLGLYTLKQCR